MSQIITTKTDALAVLCTSQKTMLGLATDLDTHLAAAARARAILASEKLQEALQRAAVIVEVATNQQYAALKTEAQRDAQVLTILGQTGTGFLTRAERIITQECQVAVDTAHAEFARERLSSERVFMAALGRIAGTHDDA